MAKGSIGMVQRITGPVVDVLFNVDEILGSQLLSIHNLRYLIKLNLTNF